MFSKNDSLNNNYSSFSFSVFFFGSVSLLIYLFKKKTQDKIKMQKKEPDKTPEIPVYWIETSDSVSRHFQFEPDGQLSVSLFLFSFLEFSNPDPLSLL
jgi:hypothetical protein